MPPKAAGLLMYRMVDELEFFLVHPGGPFWAKKNEGAWGIPKGLIESDEELLVAAQREFHEETGIVTSPPYQDLGSVKMKSGKIIYAWAFAGEWNPQQGIVSNMISLEWPPRSNKHISIPEVDRAEWMSFEKAGTMIIPAQAPFLLKARELIQF